MSRRRCPAACTQRPRTRPPSSSSERAAMRNLSGCFGGRRRKRRLRGAQRISPATRRMARDYASAVRASLSIKRSRALRCRPWAREVTLSVSPARNGQGSKSQELLAPRTSAVGRHREAGALFLPALRADGTSEGREAALSLPQDKRSRVLETVRRLTSLYRRTAEPPIETEPGGGWEIRTRAIREHACAPPSPALPITKAAPHFIG